MWNGGAVRRKKVTTAPNEPTRGARGAGEHRGHMGVGPLEECWQYLPRGLEAPKEVLEVELSTVLAVEPEGKVGAKTKKVMGF